MKVQSSQLHYPCKHGGVPIAIGMKLGNKEGEFTEFIITLPV